jgi:hypothetical protein
MANWFEEPWLVGYLASQPDFELADIEGETVEHRVGRGFFTCSRPIVELLRLKDSNGKQWTLPGLARRLN